MNRRNALLILLVVCFSLSSFKKKCNNDGDETSLKKDKTGTMINPGSDWHFSPIYDFLAI